MKRYFLNVAALIVLVAVIVPGKTFAFAGNGHQLTLNDNKMTNDTTKKRDLVLTRVFPAPLEAVWKTWSDPELVMKWWGPTGFTSPSCKMDFREGGTTLVCMRAPREFGGQDMYNTWAYTKIVPMERIEHTLDWADKDGKRIDPSSIGLPPDMPRDVKHLITFKDLGNGKTEMTITEFGYTSDQHFELSKAGLEQCLDKMGTIFGR